jgi:hypothetical protein
MNITRRRFLGGLLASVPLAYVPLSRWRAKEAEYTLGFEGHPPAVITAYTDGTLEGVWQGKRMTMRTHGGWTLFGLNLNGVGSESFGTRVRRPEPNVLEVDYIIHRPRGVDGLGKDAYHFSSYERQTLDGTLPPQYSYQPLPPLLT